MALDIGIELLTLIMFGSLLALLMAAMLERAGIINEMFDVIYKLLGGLKGGVAAATILATMVGVIGAAVAKMGIIALPAMLKRGYDPKIAMGPIMAGGTLGILIPPSILAIIYAVVAEQSVANSLSAPSFRVFCCQVCTSPTP